MTKTDQSTNQTSNNYSHATAPCIGVLLTNLGTPTAPDKSSVRKFLKEFLWDARVVEVPRLIWWFVLNVVILNTRPKRSAAAYAKVWTTAGSPLMTISKQQLTALQAVFKDSNIKIEIGMRYGQPTIADGIQKLQQLGADRIVVLPLYPQYSATTTATTFDAVANALATIRRIPEIRFVNHYHDHPQYIHAVANSIETFQKENNKAELLLFSFHGIPQDYFDKGDPYFCECQKTARLVAKKLGLADNQWKISFQSRLGPKQWLQPYTDETLKQSASSGTESVQVICPGFSVDCLETLEEIAMENRDVFLDNGGKSYQYIPCLNDQPNHIELMRQLIMTHTQGWQSERVESNETQRRAMSMGAKQ